ncbi:Six-hairpin glycosidase-like protein [Panaeolus papilionaceus]|nr:Six-hairpin glycosidase-like protein [Panaeolus papilionaceus]
MAPWTTGISVVAVALSNLISSEPTFDNQTISRVRTNLLDIAHASWEVGTASEALLELSWPELSVFNASAFPPSRHLTGSAFPKDVVQIANDTVSKKPPNTLALLANQGSAADPASIGVAVLLANWTNPDRTNTAYAKAAGDQVTYLLKNTPRTASGAISHRANEVQLWSDFVYMVPPFIAYYGALEGGDGGRALMQVAYDQCRLYRDGLRDDSGLWKHIMLGSFQDRAHWATGNAWAAAGMLRVLSTLNHSSDARQFSGQQANLTSWIDEILETSWSYQGANGTLHNVIDDPQTFGDTASTALLAATTYRMAIFKNSTTLIPNADRAFKLINDSITSEGWLRNSVNPITFHSILPDAEHSPEGQAFVLLLQAAKTAFNKFLLTRFHSKHH